MELSDRERNTILAALRYWQWTRGDLIRSLNTRAGSILDIETNGNTEDALTDAEIDTLCEEINA